MNKIVKIEMEENKDILIRVNNVLKLTIKEGNRKIQANDIYELLNYSNGDSISIEKVNEKEQDVSVLQFFCELLNDIVNKLKTEEDADDKKN